MYAYTHICILLLRNWCVLCMVTRLFYTYFCHSHYSPKNGYHSPHAKKELRLRDLLNNYLKVEHVSRSSERTIKKYRQSLKWTCSSLEFILPSVLSHGAWPEQEYPT